MQNRLQISSTSTPIQSTLHNKFIVNSLLQQRNQKG